MVEFTLYLCLASFEHSGSCWCPQQAEDEQWKVNHFLRGTCSGSHSQLWGNHREKTKTVMLRTRSKRTAELFINKQRHRPCPLTVLNVYYKSRRLWLAQMAEPVAITVFVKWSGLTEPYLPKEDITVLHYDTLPLQVRNQDFCVVQDLVGIRREKPWNL